MNATRLLTDGEAALLLRMLPKRLDVLARSGGIPHVLLPDGEIRFDPDDLRAWVAEHKQPAGTPNVPESPAMQ